MLPEIAATVLPYTRAARRLLRGQRRSRPRHRLQWVEGLVWVKLCLHARAEQAFELALSGFLSLNAPFEIALVSLDLGQLYWIFGQWEDLEALAAETFRRFRELSGDTEAVAALSLWIDAVRMRSDATAAIDTARKTIEARMRP